MPSLHYETPYVCSCSQLQALSRSEARARHAEEISSITTLRLGLAGQRKRAWQSEQTHLRPQRQTSTIARPYQREAVRAAMAAHPRLPTLLASGRQDSDKTGAYPRLQNTKTTRNGQSCCCSTPLIDLSQQGRLPGIGRWVTFAETRSRRLAGYAAVTDWPRSKLLMRASCAICVSMPGQAEHQRCSSLAVPGSAWRLSAVLGPSVGSCQSLSEGFFRRSEHHKAACTIWASEKKLHQPTPCER